MLEKVRTNGGIVEREVRTPEKVEDNDLKHVGEAYRAFRDRYPEPGESHDHPHRSAQLPMLPTSSTSSWAASVCSPVPNGAGKSTLLDISPILARARRRRADGAGVLRAPGRRHPAPCPDAERAGIPPPGRHLRPRPGSRDPRRRPTGHRQHGARPQRCPGAHSEPAPLRGEPGGLQWPGPPGRCRVPHPLQRRRPQAGGEAEPRRRRHARRGPPPEPEPAVRLRPGPWPGADRRRPSLPARCKEPGRATSSTLRPPPWGSPTSRPTGGSSPS